MIPIRLFQSNRCTSFLRSGIFVLCFSSTVEVLPQETPLEQAQAYYEQDNYEACVSLASESIQAVPCDSKGYGLLGRCYGRLGQLKQARLNFEKALKCDSLSAGAHYGLGTVALFEGDHALAEQGLSMALRLNPEHTDGLRNLSSLYIEQERWVLARDTCIRGLQIDSLNTDLLVNIAAVSQGLRQYRQAVRWVTKAVEINPEDSHSTVALAGLLLKIGSYEEALAILEPYDGDPRANRWKGESLFYTEAYELALPHLKDGLFVNVSGSVTSRPMAKVLRLTADAHYEIAQIDSALAYYERLQFEASGQDSSYAAHVLNRLRAENLDGNKAIIPNTTFSYQGSELTCLQASVVSVLAFWDADLRKEDKVFLTKGQAESPIDVLYYLSKNNPETASYLLQWEMADLKNSVELGYPAIALLAFQDPDMVHTVAVVGFDEIRDVMIVNDPFEEKLKKLPTAEFEESWRKGRNEIILIVPKDHADLQGDHLIDGENELSLFFEGYNSLEMGAMDQAFSTFDQLASRTTTSTIQLSLGDAFRLLRRYDAAEQILKGFAQKHPRDAMPLLLLSGVAEDQKKHQQARDYLADALRLTDGDFQRAYLDLGGIDFNEGRLQDAQISYEKAARLYPDGGPYGHVAYFWLAFVQFMQGDVEDSLANFRRSAQEWAGFRPAWQALEKVRQLNQFSEGRADEEKILEIAHAINEDFNSFGSFGASQ